MVNQPIYHAISKAKYSEKDQIWILRGVGRVPKAFIFSGG